MNSNSGYWKAEVDDEYRDETAFESHHGLFHFIWMPFRLKGHLVRFNPQWTSYYPWVIFSKSPEEHIDHVRQFSKLMKDAGLTLKLKKGEFFTNPVDYLGHGIKSGCLAVSSPTIHAICSLESLSSIT